MSGLKLVQLSSIGDRSQYLVKKTRKRAVETAKKNIFCQSEKPKKRERKKGERIIFAAADRIFGLVLHRPEVLSVFLPLSPSLEGGEI